MAHPSTHLDSHHFPLLMGLMFGRNFHFSLGISDRISYSQHLLLLLPLEPFFSKIIPHLVVTLYKTLSTEFFLYLFTNLFCTLLHIIWIDKTSAIKLPTKTGGKRKKKLF